MASAPKGQKKASELQVFHLPPPDTEFVGDSPVMTRDGVRFVAG
ncbi:MAG: hypothetical protein WCO60_12130 [Verrucomicrobiota bacterium]